MSTTSNARSLRCIASHLWVDHQDTARILSVDARKRLEQRIADSEVRHLGELRICVESGLSAIELWRGKTAKQRALELFSTLRVWDTEHNNGVLIYLLWSDRRIEILADRGLMQRLSNTDHWQDMLDEISTGLKQGQIEQALSQAIDRVGQLMQDHFPARPDQNNVNELPNAIVLL